MSASETSNPEQRQRVRLHKVARRLYQALVSEDPDRARLVVRELMDRPEAMRNRLSQTLTPWVTLIADYIRKNTIETVIGPMSFGEDGEWKAPRIIYAQFQNVDGNDIGQFKDMSRQVVVWPPELKTGNLIYPYDQATK